MNEDDAALRVNRTRPTGRWEPALSSERLERWTATMLAESDAEWFRLIPVGPELAAESLPARDTRTAPPRPRPIRVDAKIIGPGTLIDANFAPNVLCSLDLARALAAAGASGWRVRPVRHTTRHTVCGHPYYVLSCRATIGPFVDTTFHTFRPPRSVPAWGRAGSPVGSVTIAAATKRVPLIAWTEYVELDSDMPWRGLILHRSVASKLLARTSSSVHLEPISVLDATPARARRRPPPKRPRRAKGPPVSALIGYLRKTAVAADHVLPPSGGRPTVRRALDAIGLPPSSPLATLLAATNGPLLFGGALAFCPVGHRDIPRARLRSHSHFDQEEIVREQRYRRFTAGGVDIPDGWYIFARGYGGEIYWAIDNEGHVRGYGMSGTGVEYGPDAPFARWLGDQIRDLEPASQRRAPGAAVMVGA